MNASDRYYEYSEGRGHRSDDDQRPWGGNRTALDSLDDQCRQTDRNDWVVRPQQIDSGPDPRRRFHVLQADNLGALKTSVIQAELVLVAFDAHHLPRKDRGSDGVNAASGTRA